MAQQRPLRPPEGHHPLLIMPIPHSPAHRKKQSTMAQGEPCPHLGTARAGRPPRPRENRSHVCSQPVQGGHCGPGRAASTPSSHIRQAQPPHPQVVGAIAGPTQHPRAFCLRSALRARSWQAGGVWACGGCGPRTFQEGSPGTQSADPALVPSDKEGECGHWRGRPHMGLFQVQLDPCRA